MYDVDPTRSKWRMPRRAASPKPARVAIVPRPRGRSPPCPSIWNALDATPNDGSPRGTGRPRRTSSAGATRGPPRGAPPRGRAGRRTRRTSRGSRNRNRPHRNPTRRSPPPRTPPRDARTTAKHAATGGRASLARAEHERARRSRMRRLVCRARGAATLRRNQPTCNTSREKSRTVHGLSVIRFCKYDDSLLKGNVLLLSSEARRLTRIRPADYTRASY